MTVPEAAMAAAERTGESVAERLFLLIPYYRGTDAELAREIADALDESRENARRAGMPESWITPWFDRVELAALIRAKQIVKRNRPVAGTA